MPVFEDDQNDDDQNRADDDQCQYETDARLRRVQPLEYGRIMTELDLDLVQCVHSLSDQFGRARALSAVLVVLVAQREVGFRLELQQISQVPDVAGVTVERVAVYVQSGQIAILLDQLG